MELATTSDPNNIATWAIRGDVIHYGGCFKSCDSHMDVFKSCASHMHIKCSHMATMLLQGCSMSSRAIV